MCDGPRVGLGRSPVSPQRKRLRKDGMTVTQVSGIVGTAGTTVGRYTVGRTEYLTRLFDGSHVWYRNSRVYARVWI